MGGEDFMRGKIFLRNLSWAHKDNAPSLQLSAMHRRIVQRSGIGVLTVGARGLGSASGRMTCHMTSCPIGQLTEL